MRCRTHVNGGTQSSFSSTEGKRRQVFRQTQVGVFSAATTFRYIDIKPITFRRREQGFSVCFSGANASKGGVELSNRDWIETSGCPLHNIHYSPDHWGVPSRNKPSKGANCLNCLCKLITQVLHPVEVNCVEVTRGGVVLGGSLGRVDWWHIVYIGNLLLLPCAITCYVHSLAFRRQWEEGTVEIKGLRGEVRWTDVDAVQSWERNGSLHNAGLTFTS